jgi:hypothetical protein
MMRLSRKLTYSNVISTLCLILLLGGGTAYAASQLEKESVGPNQLKKGAVTPAKLSKASKATLTGPKGAPGATGPSGPQGIPGPKGDKGEAGATATALWAVVEETGTLIRGSGTTGSKGLTTAGEYEVDFDRDVSHCSYQGTMGFQSGEIEAEARGGVPDGVYVETIHAPRSGGLFC